MTIDEICAHWGLTKEELKQYAADELTRHRTKQKESKSFPQDGSSGQYDAWTRSLVAAILD